MKKNVLTRRRFVAASAAASATVIAAPFVRTAHAAGKLSIGFWDHWVPGANDVLRALVMEWAEKEKVDAQIDFITSQGEKLRLVIAAESRPGPATTFYKWAPGGRTRTQTVSSRSTTS